MLTGRRWIVRLSRFPVGTPGDVIGSVVAEDNRSARALSIEMFGPLAVVELETAGDRARQSDPMAASRRDAAHDALISTTAMRIMTPLEIQMARAVGVARYQGQFKGTIRRLHAESFKPAPEISDELAIKLRAIVQALRGQLSSELLESVGAP